eukprot:gene18242-biopygen5399
MSGPVRSGPVRSRSGPVRPGPVRSGPVRSGPVRSGPVRSGPVRSGIMGDAGGWMSTSGETNSRHRDRHFYAPPRIPSFFLASCWTSWPTRSVVRRASPCRSSTVTRRGKKRVRSPASAGRRGCRDPAGRPLGWHSLTYCVKMASCVRPTQRPLDPAPGRCTRDNGKYMVGGC